MATLGQDPKRLGIFFFFDAQGVVSIIIELVGGCAFLVVILRKGRL